MQTAHSVNGNSARDAINDLERSLEKTIDQNRTLFSEMAQFTNRESMLFVQRQLDHAQHAFTLFGERRDLNGLIGAQQAWLKDVMSDYAEQSVRCGEMFRSFTEHVHDRMKRTASEFNTKAEQEMEAAERVVQENGRAAE